jgi:hypothetical protein
MSINRKELEGFIDVELPKLLKDEEIKIEKVQNKNSKDWDTPSRKVMNDYFHSWLKNYFNLEEEQINDVLWVEGTGRSIPETKGDFFGSKCCPDIVLKINDEFKVAVELDHGIHGYQLRNAIAKASSNVIIGRFDRSIVLFFVEHENKKELKKKFNLKDHVDFFEKYKKDFNTSVEIVTNYQPMP